MNENNICYEIRELLSSYMDHQLTDEQNKAVEEHLAQCSDCRQEYEELLFVTELLQSIEQVPVPDRLERQLHTALSEEGQKIRQKNKSSQKENHRFRWRIVGTLAAVFAVCVVSYTMFDEVLPHMWQEQEHQATEQLASPDTVQKDGNESIGSETAKEESRKSQESHTEKQRQELTEEEQAALKDVQQNKESSAEAADQELPLQKQLQNASAEENMTTQDTTDDAEGNPSFLEESAPMPMMAPRSMTDSLVTPAASGGASSGGSNNSAAEDDVSNSKTTEAGAYQFLIEEALQNYNYEITKSDKKNDGRWYFTVFIFSEKGGKMIEKEMEAVGSDGTIQWVDPDKS